MRKLLSFLLLFSSVITGYGQVNRATVDTYWSARVVPATSQRQATWLSFYNVVDNPATGTGSVVMSITPTISTPTLTGVTTLSVTSSTNTVSGALWNNRDSGVNGTGVTIRTNTTDVWAFSIINDTQRFSVYLRQNSAWNGSWIGSATQDPVHFVTRVNSGGVPAITISSQTSGAVSGVLINGPSSSTTTAQLDVYQGGGVNIISAANGSGIPYWKISGIGSMGIGTGTTTINSSSLFEMVSTTKGFLPPRMTAAQASLISSPAEGLIIYVTDTNGTFTAKGWWGYDGAAWAKLNN